MSIQVACVWAVGIICATVFACRVARGGDRVDLDYTNRLLNRIARALEKGKEQ